MKVCSTLGQVSAK